MAGPWFAVHRVGEGWKSLEKIWMSNGAKTNVAIVQTRLRFSDDREIYSDSGANVEGFDFAQEVENLACEKQLKELERAQQN